MLFNKMNKIYYEKNGRSECNGKSRHEKKKFGMSKEIKRKIGIQIELNIDHIDEVKCGRTNCS